LKDEVDLREMFIDEIKRLEIECKVETVICPELLLNIKKLIGYEEKEEYSESLNS
jgi:hypothetical protein